MLVVCNHVTFIKCYFYLVVCGPIHGLHLVPSNLYVGSMHTVCTFSFSLFVGTFGIQSLVTASLCEMQTLIEVFRVGCNSNWAKRGEDVFHEQTHYMPDSNYVFVCLIIILIEDSNYMESRFKLHDIAVEFEWGSLREE